MRQRHNDSDDDVTNVDDDANVDDDMMDKNDQDTDEMDKNDQDTDDEDEDGDGLAYPSSFLNIPGGLSSLLPPNMQVRKCKTDFFLNSIICNFNINMITFNFLVIFHF